MKKFFIVLIIISLVSCKPEEKPVNNDWYARILEQIYYDVEDGASGRLADDFEIGSKTFDQRMEQIYLYMEAGAFNQQIRSTEYAAGGGAFELPIAGATGYAAVDLKVYRTAGDLRSEIFSLQPGQGFTILREENDWWNIEVGNIIGWVMHRYCLINLPDIIPSIVYDNTNTYNSLFRSSGFSVPSVTGTALYEGRDFNARLGRYEYISAVLYRMAPKIFAAQQAALAHGHTLIIYEAFRPAEAHDRLHEELSFLVETNPIVMEGVTANMFSLIWFLAPSPYNHQRGTAIDVTLGRIYSWETRVTGDYTYVHVNEYSEFIMQSPLHELSAVSAIFSPTVSARSPTVWRDAFISDKATDGTILLIKYCTDAGLTPLASEWWHFNDLESTDVATEIRSIGRYNIMNTYSRPPRRF